MRVICGHPRCGRQVGELKRTDGEARLSLTRSVRAYLDADGGEVGEPPPPAALLMGSVERRHETTTSTVSGEILLHAIVCPNRHRLTIDTAAAIRDLDAGKRKFVVQPPGSTSR